jgi:hypothetical protein
MAQQMSRTSARSRNTCPVECPTDDNRNSTVRAEGTKGRAATDKDSIGVSSRAAMFEIVHERTPHLVCQWQAGMVPSLSRDMNPRIFPVDVTESQLRDVAGS